jgi:chromosome segregation ATPase
MYAFKRSVAALLLLTAMAVSPALAADKKADPNKEQVRRMQQAQRKLEQEKAQLAAQKAAVESELDEEKKKAEGEALRASALKRDVNGLRSARDAMAAKLAETEAELRKTQEAQRAAEAEGKRLQSALAAEKQQHATCVERGNELRKVGGEVLELYEKKTCLDSALQSEPFTGLKRVEIENAVEDLRDKLEVQRSGS